MDSQDFLQHLSTIYRKQEPFLPGQGNPAFRTFRRESLARAQTLGIPSVRLDAYKHARFDTLINNHFIPYLHTPEKHQLIAINTLITNHDDSINLVFLNGHYVPSLSHNNHCTIRLQSLSRLTKVQPELLLDFQNSKLEHDFFGELNQALCNDGAVVIIPENLQLDKVVRIYHILVNNSEQSTMIHPQTYIHFGKNSHASIIEENITLSSKTNNLFNSQTTVTCEQGAHCELTRQTQHTSLSLGFHHLNANLMSNSRLTLTELAWGAHYQRHTMCIALKEPSCSLDFHGLMLPGSYEHCDWNSKVTHYAVAGKSEQKIKSVIAQDGHSSFLGKIVVNQAALQTNTLMINDNLLLGEMGQADSAPQLEILADEVKCNHAATVTQLDEQALFYLRSRGFPQDDAKHLMLQSFTQDVIGNILHPAILEHCQSQVANRVEQLLRGTL